MAMCTGCARRWVNRAPRSRARCRAETERLPSYPHGHNFRAIALFNLGRFDDCVAAAEQALRPGPHDPTAAQRKAQIASCHFMRGDYPGAAIQAREAQQLNPRLPLAPLLLAASLARDGQPGEARDIVAAYRQRQPAFRVAR
jgi:Flp pilus assembly protein TadD